MFRPLPSCGIPSLVGGWALNLRLWTKTTWREYISCFRSWSAKQAREANLRPSRSTSLWFTPITPCHCDQRNRGNNLILTERTVKFHVSIVLNQFRIRRGANLILLSPLRRNNQGRRHGLTPIKNKSPATRRQSSQFYPLELACAAMFRYSSMPNAEL